MKRSWILACLAAAACGADDAPGDGPGDRDGGAPLDRTPPVTTATPAGGPVHQGALTVTLSTDEPAVIRYTLDGSAPGPDAAVYAGPLVLDRTTTLRFFAVDPAGNAEAPRQERYRIDLVRRLLLQVGAS